MGAMLAIPQVRSRREATCMSVVISGLRTTPVIAWTICTGEEVRACELSQLLAWHVKEVGAVETSRRAADWKRSRGSRRYDHRGTP
jgi:hypothetical protein